ncbi:MAG: hypothetical protein NVSMB13_00020 [Mycobacteriales bacterium]
MSERFAVVPESLVKASGAFFQLADELAAAERHLAGALADTGGMAGGDEPGAAFARFYDPHARALEDNLGRLGVGLAALADGLAAMRHNYGVADVSATVRPGPDQSP